MPGAAVQAAAFVPLQILAASEVYPFVAVAAPQPIVLVIASAAPHILAAASVVAVGTRSLILARARELQVAGVGVVGVVASEISGFQRPVAWATPEVVLPHSTGSADPTVLLAPRERICGSSNFLIPVAG